VPAGNAHFVSLAELIRSRPSAAEAQPVVFATAPANVLEQPALQPPTVPAPSESSELPDALRAARLFRAALADAFDARLAELTRELAAAVLGRELQLAPVDLEALARRLIAERRADEPLCLRVAPPDAGIACELPVVADPELRAGDAVLVCRSGDINARLAVRLAGVLAALDR
jgi:Flagellar assembly protein FliH